MLSQYYNITFIHSPLVLTFMLSGGSPCPVVEQINTTRVSDIRFAWWTHEHERLPCFTMLITLFSTCSPVIHTYSWFKSWTCPCFMMSHSFVYVGIHVYWPHCMCPELALWLRSSSFVPDVQFFQPCPGLYLSDSHTEAAACDSTSYHTTLVCN